MGMSSSVDMGPSHPDTCPWADPSEVVVGKTGVDLGIRLYLSDMIEDKERQQLITNLDDILCKAGECCRKSQLSWRY